MDPRQVSPRDTRLSNSEVSHKGEPWPAVKQSRITSLLFRSLGWFRGGSRRARLRTREETKPKLARVNK